MACFVAPVVEAVVVTIVKKSVEKKERQAALSAPGRVEAAAAEMDGQSAIPFSRKLGWLTKLLWGGSFLLAIEHIWHGEVVPWPPFLTAMHNPADIAPMLLEIATVGVAMAVLITAVWGVMVLVLNRIEKRAKKPAVARAAEG
jgi:hypothetical protein